MSPRFKKKIMAWGLNILGVLLVCLVPFLGPLPGPGGVPLLLAGLSLLSINNRWAKKLKVYIEKKGLDLTNLMFPDHKKIQLIWDIGIYLASGLSLYIFKVFDLSWKFELAWKSIFGGLISIMLGFLIMAWFRNRHRWHQLLQILKITTAQNKNSPKPKTKA